MSPEKPRSPRGGSEDPTAAETRHDHPAAAGTRHDLGTSSGEPTDAAETWLDADRDPMTGARSELVREWHADVSPSGPPGAQDERDRGGRDDADDPRPGSASMSPQRSGSPEEERS
jgi:hypothetical protein